MGVSSDERTVLDRLGEEIRAAAWELAAETIEEGLREGGIPRLARLGRVAQLGDVPTFIAELGRQLADPQPGRLRSGSPLAERAREHAREREALGFAPREIVTEFLLLRGVLWRFVSRSGVLRETGEVLLAERLLNDTIDRLVTECVAAYFERATAELALRARLDALTGLLNHQAFTTELERELQRARRYGGRLALAFLDIDRFKSVNDTLGHPEGDRVLRSVAALLRDNLRASDLAGRMGGDEFAAALVETGEDGATHVLERFRRRVDQLVAAGELPHDFGISAGVAHFPAEAQTADALFRLADARLYEMKPTGR